MQTISKIPSKPRKSAIQSEDYALHSTKEAQAYTRMSINPFRKNCLLHNCLPIIIGNKYYYKLSALNKMIDNINQFK